MSTPRRPSPASRRPSRLPARAAAGDPAEIEALLAQIEAELSRSSKKVLRRLVSQLSDADLDGSDLDGSGFDEAGEWDADLDDGLADFDEEDLYEDELARRRRPWDGGFYAPKAPIKVEGGLAAKSKRGAIGETWWSRRFLDAVEPYLVGGRSGRGRSYARRGQVVELAVAPGLISAKVQGTRRVPYRVRIAMPAASAEQWERVLASLASQAGYSASMLAGELPHEVEEVFSGAGVALFPGPRSRLTSDCTCPDWANPCKHVAAVCYLVAEQFDRDPFALLAWRGRGREEVLERLRELRGGETSVPSEAPEGPARTAPPLDDCLLGFWKAGPELASVQVRPAASEAAGAVLRQLARGLVEVRGRDLGEVLAPAYKEMSLAAGKRALGAGA
jgi:uncharacterized Zn finger protein